MTTKESYTVKFASHQYINRFWEHSVDVTATSIETAIRKSWSALKKENAEEVRQGESYGLPKRLYIESIKWQGVIHV